MKELKWVFAVVVVAGLAGASASVWSTPDPTSVPRLEAPAKFSQPVPVRMSLSGSIDERVLNMMMITQHGEFDGCYTEFLRKNPGVSGTVLLHFAVQPDGRVGEACQSRGTTLPMEVGRCITDRLTWMQFPLPLDMQSVSLEYRFDFVPPPGNS